MRRGEDSDIDEIPCSHSAGQEGNTMTRHAGSAPHRARDDQADARGTQRLGPQRGKRDADDDEEKMSRTGELVISLQGQVETLTAAVRTLARQIPAPLVSVHQRPSDSASA